MPSSKYKISIHPLQYLLIAAGIFVMIVLERSVPMLADGLLVTPFILISTATALYGGYTSGILAVVLCSLAVEYVIPPAGFALNEDAIFKMVEFMVIGLIIFLIAWRSRTLRASNVALKEMTKTLQDITASLHVDASGNEKQLKKLNDVNRRLVSLVNQFIQDDDYWARKITTPVTLPEKQFSNPQLQRAKSSRTN